MGRILLYLHRHTLAPNTVTLILASTRLKHSSVIMFYWNDGGIPPPFEVTKSSVLVLLWLYYCERNSSTNMDDVVNLNKDQAQN